MITIKENSTKEIENNFCILEHSDQIVTSGETTLKY